MNSVLSLHRLPQHSLGYLRTISRKFKAKKLFILLLAVLALYLASNELLNCYFLIKCWRLKYQALNQICGSYFDRKYIGQSCEAFCVRKELSLSGCPNLRFHQGKDFVFDVMAKNENQYILKSRELQLPLNFTINFISNHDRTLLIRSIRQQIVEAFKGALDLNSISNLLPYDRPISVASLNDLDFVSLLNIHDLIQDNEYLLSIVLNNVEQFESIRILPRVVSTCGNWYLVEKSSFIVDYSFLDQTHTAEEKLVLSRKLVDFLVSFESLNLELQLCDVKYEHFGAGNSPVTDLNSSGLVLIDSDMIYHRLNIEENISAIQNCEKDADCDFNDCKGTCTRRADGTSTCNLNRRDNNLKRICRNLFFVEPFKFDELHDAKSLGLLVNLEPALNEALKSVYDLCFRDELINRQTNEPYLLNERIEQIRTALAAL